MGGDLRRWTGTRSMTIETARKRLCAFLRSRRMKVTSERLALLEEIWRRDGYVDVPRLLSALDSAGRKVSRATVYRNLELLVECGLVRRRRVDWRSSLYQCASGNHERGYLSCLRCGRLEEFSNAPINAELDELCRVQGFSGRGVEILIRGLCELCASRGGARRPRPGVVSQPSAGSG